MASPLVVGFDLDLTLIDSRPGIAATYRALSERTGVYIDADVTVTRLGPPLEVELAYWFPEHEITAAKQLYRELYPGHAVLISPALPGARAAFDAVRELGGRIIVITGKHGPNALLHLAELELDADAVVGRAWAEDKVVAMLEHGVGVYIGDHPADMAAARAVPAEAIGVLTGDHTEAELIAAGATEVLVDLTGFPAWLEQCGISVGLASRDR